MVSIEAKNTLLSRLCRAFKVWHLESENLGVDDFVVTGGVEVCDAGGFVVADAEVEAPGGVVAGAAVGFDDDEAAGAGADFIFGESHQGLAEAARLAARIDGDPIDIESSEGTGRGTVTDPAGGTAVEVGGEGLVVAVGAFGQGFVENLAGDFDFVVAEKVGGDHEFENGVAVGGERAADEKTRVRP